MAAINPGRVVIGPALDGGYYLIGLATPEARLFSGIEWGARDVCRRTVRTALDLGLEVRMLPWLRDIDTGQEWHEYLVEADGAVPDLTPSGVSRRRS